MVSDEDERLMRKALELSRRAMEYGNEPFGAVLAKGGSVVFWNENQIRTRHDPTFHAEEGLIRRFCAETGVTDLSSYTLYSSCEPCFMCSGAIVWAHVGRLVYGASNRDLGGILGKEGTDCSSIVFGNSSHAPEVTRSVLREECVSVLEEYFGTRADGSRWHRPRRQRPQMSTASTTDVTATLTSGTQPSKNAAIPDRR